MWHLRKLFHSSVVLHHIYVQNDSQIYYVLYCVRVIFHPCPLQTHTHTHILTLTTFRGHTPCNNNHHSCLWNMSPLPSLHATGQYVILEPYRFSGWHIDWNDSLNAVSSHCILLSGWLYMHINVLSVMLHCSDRKYTCVPMGDKF